MESKLDEKLEENKEEKNEEHHSSPSQLKRTAMPFLAVAGDPSHQSGEKAEEKRTPNPPSKHESGDKNGGTEERNDEWRQESDR